MGLTSLQLLKDGNRLLHGINRLHRQTQLLQAQEEEGSNAGTMSGLKEYMQYFADHAKKLYENLTEKGE